MSLAMGAVGGPLQASCSGGGAGVHRLLAGQEPLQEKNANRRCLAAASFFVARGDSNC
jgi:hypothetical protein